MTSLIPHLLNYSLKLWQRGLDLILALLETPQLTIMPTCDPYVWLLINTSEQMQALTAHSDAVIIGSRQVQQAFSTELQARRFDEIDPGFFEFDPYRDQERLKLEREGHKKATGAAIRSDTHKNNLPRNTTPDQGMGNRDQTKNAAHPLLANDPRFAGVEPNVSPLPDVNENADEKREELQMTLQKVYAPLPSAPILTNNPMR